MIRQDLCRSAFSMLVVVVLSFLISWNATAQKGMSSLSGRVMDAEGEPVAGLKLAIKPVEISRGWEKGPRAPISSWSRAVTDKNGLFSITNIDPVSSRLVMFPENGSDFEIISLEFGDITVYSAAFRGGFPTWFGKPTIEIKPGSHLDNVVVNVQKPRMRISGRVLFPDGKPLTNMEIDLTVLRRRRSTKFIFFSTGGSGGSSRRFVKTDAEGYFVTYLLNKESEYLVLVKYEGVSTKSRWFYLRQGQRKDNLILRLRGFEEHRLNRSKRVKARQAAWTVNPENHHAYKIIECDSWDDAQAKAQAENAYLVSINDEKEQKWLESVYWQKTFFWIGLRVPEKGTAWQWHSGQPLVYANWGPSGRPENTSSVEGIVPIALIFSTKKWMTINSKSPLLPIVKHAILEKEDY